MHVSVGTPIAARKLLREGDVPSLAARALTQWMLTQFEAARILQPDPGETSAAPVDVQRSPVDEAELLKCQ
jgi:hypothetical protein